MASASLSVAPTANGRPSHSMGAIRTVPAPPPTPPPPADPAAPPPPMELGAPAMTAPPQPPPPPPPPAPASTTDVVTPPAPVDAGAVRSVEAQPSAAPAPKPTKARRASRADMFYRAAATAQGDSKGRRRASMPVVSVAANPGRGAVSSGSGSAYELDGFAQRSARRAVRWLVWRGAVRKCAVVRDDSWKSCWPVLLFRNFRRATTNTSQLCLTRMVPALQSLLDQRACPSRLS